MSQIDELRKIINGSDADVLRELKERIESIEQRARDVAEVLPAAIDERVSADNRLVDALKQPVAIGLKQAIRNEPDAYSEILYPVMAPSIRRLISQAMSSMIVTINQTIESATTSQGVKLRLEAWRTGVPYAQLMLSGSSPYRVEHAYLIDRETTLLIKESHASDVSTLDGDAISAMFSAIQSFVQDSFKQDENSRLTEFKSEQQSERHNIWIVHGSSMMLACVILGDAPERLREKLYDALDGIHVNYANESANFDGDVSSFQQIERHVDPLVLLDEKTMADEAKKASKTNFILPLLMFVGFLALCAYFFIRSSTLSTIEHHMQKTPGVAVTDVYWSEGQVVIEGLKDPDAVLPFETLREEGVHKDKIKMQTIPFRSLEYSMELQRFKKEFNLPQGVQFGVGGERVTLSGEAPLNWLYENELRIRQLSADHRLDASALSASLSSVNELIARKLGSKQAASINSIIISTDVRTVIRLSGRFNTDLPAELGVLFADDYWVDVNFTSK